MPKIRQPIKEEIISSPDSRNQKNIWGYIDLHQPFVSSDLESDSVKYELLQNAAEIGKLAAELLKRSKEVESDLQDDWPQGEDKSVTSYRIQACIANTQILKSGITQIIEFAETTGLSGAKSRAYLDPESYSGHENLPLKTKRRLQATLRVAKQNSQRRHTESVSRPSSSAAPSKTPEPAVIDLTVEAHSSEDLKSPNKKKRKKTLSTSDSSSATVFPNVESVVVKKEDECQPTKSHKEAASPRKLDSNSTPNKSSDSAKDIDDQFTNFYKEKKKSKDVSTSNLSPGLLKMSSVETVDGAASTSRKEVSDEDQDSPIQTEDGQKSKNGNQESVTSSSSEAKEKGSSRVEKVNDSGDPSPSQNEAIESTTSDDVSSDDERKKSKKKRKSSRDHPESGKAAEGPEEKSKKAAALSSDEENDDDMDEAEKKLLAAAKSSKHILDSDLDDDDDNEDSKDAQDIVSGSTDGEGDSEKPTPKTSKGKKKGAAEKKTPETVEMDENDTDLASGQDEPMTSPPGMSDTEAPEPSVPENEIDPEDLPPDIEFSDEAEEAVVAAPEKPKKTPKEKPAQQSNGSSGVDEASPPDASPEASKSENGTSKDNQTNDSSGDSDDDEIEKQLNKKPARIESGDSSDSDVGKAKKAGKKAKASSGEGENGEKESKKKRKRIRGSSDSSDFSPEIEESSEGGVEENGKEKDSDSSIQEVDSGGETVPKPKKTRPTRAKKEAKEDDEDAKETESEKKPRGRRKRAKVADSSEDSDVHISEYTDSDEGPSTSKGKKGSPKKSKTGKAGFVRKIMGEEKLSKETIDAGKAEKDRKTRLTEKQKEFNGLISFNEEESGVVGDGEEPTTSQTPPGLEAGIELTNKGPAFKQVILDKDNDTGKTLVEIDPALVKSLKKHQGEGIKFLYDATIESVSRFIRGDPGGGAILGHCMGLGKTFQVITYLQTVLMNDELSQDTQDHKGNVIQKGLKTALILAPINALLTWKTEHQKWIESNDLDVRLEVCNQKNPVHRAEVLQCWHQQGGIMVMGYDRFRMDTEETKSKKTKPKVRKIFQETLVNPGPDLIVCDEGHKLKNEKSKISVAVGKMATRRRICLTGTPLQNNLDEYFVMIHFIKPGLLGTKKEFANRFANPIKQGQYMDSTPREVSIMRRRSFILHNMLDSVVQRRDYLVLKPYLPQRKEYVVTVRLCERQCDLYQRYIDNALREADGEAPRLRMLSDYHILFRIWTHAYLLIKHKIEMDAKQAREEEDDFVTEGSTTPATGDDSDISIIESDDEKKKNKKGKGKKGSSEDDEDAHFDFIKRATETVQRGTRSRRKDGTDSDAMLPDGGDEEEGRDTPPSVRGWWNIPEGEPLVTDEDQFNLELSGKLVLLFEIMKKCEEVGDKLLVFSQSLESLNIIEEFLEYYQDTGEWWKDGHTAVNSITSKTKWGWKCPRDYLRLDGSVPAEKRKEMQDRFNAPKNHQCRLFLISTRAGSLGVDLIGANRCIIFDACWNPSHDTQSLFRVYRFGQIKPVYIYRFIAAGTMEEVIYNRQVTKLSLGLRVCDDKQIQRHFMENSLQELYRFTPHALTEEEKASSQPTFLPPKDDRLLGDVSRDNKNWVVDIREHDSLLEHQSHEKLTEDQKKEAWSEYETERRGGGLPRAGGMGGVGGVSQAIQQQQIRMQQLALQFKSQETELATMGLTWQAFVDEKMPFGRWIRQMETIYTGNNMIKAEILLVFGSFRALGHESLAKLERENKSLFERIMAGRDVKTFDQLVQEMFQEYMARGAVVDIVELQQNIVKLLAKLIGFLKLQNDISGREMSEAEIMQVISARCNLWSPPVGPGGYAANYNAPAGYAAMAGRPGAVASNMAQRRTPQEEAVYRANSALNAARNAGVVTGPPDSRASTSRDSPSTYQPYPVPEASAEPSGEGADFLAQLQAQKPEKVMIRARELQK